MHCICVHTHNSFFSVLKQNLRTSNPISPPLRTSGLFTWQFEGVSSGLFRCGCHICLGTWLGKGLSLYSIDWHKVVLRYVSQTINIIVFSSLLTIYPVFKKIEVHLKLQQADVLTSAYSCISHCQAPCS